MTLQQLLLPLQVRTLHHVFLPIEVMVMKVCVASACLRVYGARADTQCSSANVSEAPVRVPCPDVRRHSAVEDAAVLCGLLLCCVVTWRTEHSLRLPATLLTLAACAIAVTSLYSLHLHIALGVVLGCVLSSAMQHLARLPSPSDRYVQERDSMHQRSPRHADGASLP